MHNRISSIRFRITALILLFALITGTASAVYVRTWTRSSERERMIRSSEFNLNLVSGLTAQRLDSLEMLLARCCVNSDIVSYLTAPHQNSVLGSRLADQLSEQLQTYFQLTRLIFVSENGERILQSGFGTSDGLPLTPYTVDRLEGMDWGEEYGVWQGVVPDPFCPTLPRQILHLRRPVLGLGGFRRSVGTAYMLLDSSVLTEPLREYELPEGCALYLLLGERSFLCDEGLRPADWDFTVREERSIQTLNPATRIQALEDGGEKQIAVLVPMGDSGIWLAQTISEQVIDSNYRKFLAPQLLLIALLVLVQSLVLHRLFYTIFSRPMEKLQKRMQAVAGGDFSQDRSIEWPNELGEIGRGINNLSRDIKALMDHRVADEKAKQALEYQMLQHQVNPHFLYNSLNSIKWMATIQNATGIVEMTNSLARLLKYISKGQHTMIPLREELALLDDYCVIQKYRYGGALSFRKEIDPETEEAYLPRLTLQPLMENAIFHGIEPKGHGTVTVRSRREGDQLLLEVEDDGVGMDPNHPLRDDNSAAFRKVGLSNTQQRIRYAFGAEYGLSIQSRRNEFTRITIRIPIMTQVPEELELC